MIHTQECHRDSTVTRKATGIPYDREGNEMHRLTVWAILREKLSGVWVQEPRAISALFAIVPQHSENAWSVEGAP